MRIGVLGGNGTAGSQAVAALERRGHEVRVLARSTGLDVTTGAGMDAALAGLDTLVDCLGVKKATERAARPVLVDGLRLSRRLRCSRNRNLRRRRRRRRVALAVETH